MILSLTTNKARLKGLEALQEKFPKLKIVSLPHLEKEHQKLLVTDHGMVLDAKTTVVEATTQRITNLSSMHGLNLDLPAVQEILSKKLENKSIAYRQPNQTPNQKSNRN